MCDPVRCLPSPDPAVQGIPKAWGQRSEWFSGHWEATGNPTTGFSRGLWGRRTCFGTFFRILLGGRFDPLKVEDDESVLLGCFHSTAHHFSPSRKFSSPVGREISLTSKRRAVFSRGMLFRHSSRGEPWDGNKVELGSALVPS